MRRPTLHWPFPPPQAPQSEQNRRLSIAERLRWSYLISSTVPLLIVGALLLSISSRTQQQSVYNNQVYLANRIARSISNYVSDLKMQIDDYALSIRSEATSPSQRQEAALILQSAQYRHLIGLAVLGMDGKEQLHVRQLQLTAREQLRNLSGEPDVRRALDQRQITLSPITLNGDGLPSFIMTSPLTGDDGSIIGALRTEISAEFVIRELRESTDDSHSYAYIVSTDDGAQVVGDGTPDFVTTPQMRELLLRSSTSVAQYVGAHHQDVIGALAHINFTQNDQPTRWTVVVEQPAGIAFADVWQSIIILALLVLLVGVFALLWAFQQAQHFLRPLRALRAGAMALGAGELGHRIALSGDDELSDLARTFNQMAEHLQQSLDEIEHQNERLRQGLALARDIQVGLLPDRVPWSGDMVDVYARSIPAYEVGGDFYTYVALPEGRVAFAIGDISGKGVGAALLMALTSSAVESQGRELEYPAQVLTALNQLLAPRLKANHMNAALLFAVFDPHERVLRVANAGMIAPVLISTEGNRFLEVGGLPVGAFAGATYQEEVIGLHPGDALLLLSDGVVEAHNAEGELFGFERLEQTIAEARPYSDVRRLVELVIERVQAFMGDTEQHDDITLVAIRPALGVQVPAPVDDEEQTIRYATL